MIVDSGAIKNTSNTSYHRYIITECLAIIEEYVERGSGSKWDSLLLEVAIDTSAGSDDNGAIIALIRNTVPFILEGISLNITFVLGWYVLLRAIIGVSMMLVLCVSLDFTTGTLECSAINVAFLLHIYNNQRLVCLLVRNLINKPLH